MCSWRDAIRSRSEAWAPLLERLQCQPATEIGPWRRDELYERWGARIALDTNILVYAEGVNGAERQQRIRAALAPMAEDELVVPAQALGELFAVLTRKARWPAMQARAAILSWRDACLVHDTTAGVLMEAMDLATFHQYSLWDAIMLACAAHAGCRVLLSEDMQAGFIWRGVEIRTPFG